MNSLPGRWLGMWRESAPVTRFRLVLGAFAFLLALWLSVSADRPWTFDWPNRDAWRLREIVGFYTFWAALGNLGLLLGLIVSAPLWATAPTKPLPLVDPREGGRGGWFRWLVLAAMVFCAACGAMRLNFGLAHDENYSARRVIAGEYKVNKEGEVSLKPVSWEETIYYYRKPNNHILHSVLARLTWSGWQTIAPGPEDWRMKEWVIRLPAFLAGVAAVGALALLLRRVVSPRAGIVAAWLLALHPWHIRYASEARGYSLLLLLIPVVLLLWIKALEKDRWRWWLLWGLSEFALIFCYPGGAYILIVLNGLCLVWLVVRLRKETSWHPLSRWFVANVLAGMLAVQLMLPLVPQLSAYMKTDEARAPLTCSWLQSTASHFLVGVTWDQSRLPNPPYPELKTYVQEWPAVFWTLTGLAVLFGVAGYGYLLSRPFPLAPVSGAVLLWPALLGLIVAYSSQQWLFEWYLLYLLPGLVAGVAVGADWLGRFLPRAGGVILAILVVFTYALVSQPFRGWVCLHPLDTIKEAGQFVRGAGSPNAPGQDDVLSGSFPGALTYYDPRGLLLREPDQLLDLMRRADAESKGLSIIVGHPWAAAFKTPQLWRLFHETGLFFEFTRFRGLDDTRDWIVGKYQPGAVQGFDAEAFFRDRQTTPDPNRPALVYPEKP